MLRIDETTGTLVSSHAALGAEPELDRAELLTLLAAGWSAFAAEVGEPDLRLAAAAPAPGIDLLAVDDDGGRLTVVSVAARFGEALHGAATIAGWDAERLAAMHPALAAVAPGASPRVLLVGAAFDEDVLATLDWLVRNHGVSAAAYRVRLLRFGAERLLEVRRAYPAADTAPAPDFLATVAAAAAAPAPPAAAQSAPPPGVPG